MKSTKANTSIKTTNKRTSTNKTVKISRLARLGDFIKRRPWVPLALFAVLFGVAGAAYFLRSHAAYQSNTTYKNPIIDENLPDPTVIRGDGGWYQLYATGGPNSNPFPHYTSKDLVHWAKSTDTFVTPPTCTGSDKIQWAPDVAKVNDRFFITFTCGPDNRRVIGYGVSGCACGPFTYKGILVQSGQHQGQGGPDEYGTIDSHIMADGDRTYLYYGGGHIGVVELNVNGDTLSLKNNYRRIMSGKVVDGKWTTAEGAWVWKKNGWYYLYYSFGQWGTRSGAREYSLRIARSSSPMGTFEPTTYRSLVEGVGGDFRGPGHGSIATDDAGKDWNIYHAWHNGKRVVMLDPVHYGPGDWPWSNYGNGPSRTTMAGPYIGPKPEERAEDVNTFKVVTEKGCYLAGRKWVDGACALGEVGSSTPCRNAGIGSVFKVKEGFDGQPRGYCTLSVVLSVDQVACTDTYHMYYVYGIGCARRADQQSVNNAPECQSGYPYYNASPDIDVCQSPILYTK